MIKSKLKCVVIVVSSLLFLGVINHYTTYKLELLGHYSKIGAHRVNSIEKLTKTVEYFKIIELDLMYNEEDDFMDVNHPPAESINLHLESYISAINKSEKPFLWLDIKNLTKNNSTKILNILLKVFNTVDYPLDKILIETQNPNALPVFSREGFKTSYYLPYGLCMLGSKEFDDTITGIDEFLKKQPNLAISSDIQDYEILAKNFPNRIKYTWTMGSVFRNHFFQTQRALRDSKVAIVLVTYKTPNGNR